MKITKAIKDRVQLNYFKMILVTATGTDNIRQLGKFLNHKNRIKKRRLKQSSIKQP